MEEQERDPQEDERGTQPPASEGRDKAPQEGSDSEPEDDPVDSPGPQGNPASDEEALSHRQQEQDPPAGE
jgi:hypothetical protein